MASGAQVRSVWRSLVAVTLALGTLFAAGCGGDDAKKARGIATGCTLSSECASTLVCTFGRCHEACAESKDCGPGGRCITDDTGAKVCQLEAEAECIRDGDCDSPLVCAVDSRCRNECVEDVDCKIPGQTCALGGFCAENAEIDPETGGIIGAPLPEGGLPDCTAGGACSDVPECHRGAFVCNTSNQQVCQDQGFSPDGTPCGTADQVCSGGACVACVANEVCYPDAANTCRAGRMACGGAPSCANVADAAEGTPCGGDDAHVCSAGACVACVADEACLPDPGNPCVPGTRSCTGTPACVAGTPLADGDSCGTGQVCSAGACIACVADEGCTPDSGNPCKTGARTCTAGSACPENGNQPDGTGCTGGVCIAGACTPCVQDEACAPNGNECRDGRRDCQATGGPACVDQGTNKAFGTACGTSGSEYCDNAGACTTCTGGSPCVPTDVCHVGSTNCGIFPPTCDDTSNPAPDGTECGVTPGAAACFAGVCTPFDRTLTVTVGDAQPRRANELLGPVTVRLVGSGGAAVPGAPVSIVASEGAWAAPSSTNTQGNATIVARVGRKVGETYTFTVSAPGAPPVNFTATATAVANGAIHTLVNTDHSSTSGTEVIPGPGTAVHMSYAYSVVAAADGTLYIGEYCAVNKLSPLGELTRVVGNGSCGYSGDLGLATAAQVNWVDGMALDEANGRLYLADQYNNRVRVVDLGTGEISTFAGGNDTAPSPGYGDNGPADQAALYRPTHVSIGPGGHVYIVDSWHSTIRRVDAGTGIISTWLGAGEGCSDEVSVSGVTGDSTLVWDSRGQAFLSGHLCGTSVQQGNPGVVRRRSDGTFVHVAGSADGAGVTSENAQARNTYLSTSPRLAFDTAGNLFMSLHGEDRIRKVDSSTGRVTTVAGTGTAGFSGEYGAAPAAELNDPWHIAFDTAGNLLVAEQYSYTVRQITGAGSATASPVTLAVQGGNNQVVTVDAIFPAVLSVRLTSGTPNVPGARIDWKAVTEGAGLYVSTSTTNTSGVASAQGRPGLAVDDYFYEASYDDIHGQPATGSPVTFALRTSAATSGDIFTILNPDRSASYEGIPGPGTFARASYGSSVAAASDGTLYLGTQCAVLELSPRGRVSYLAGNDTCGFGGDQGLAVDARLSGAEGLALDEANQLLYVVDRSNNRIRVVNLADGSIDTFAGGNDQAAAPGYGDSGPATSAALSSPSSVAIGPNGDVYIVDGGHDRIRRVSGGIITNWVSGSGTCSGAADLYSLQTYSQILWSGTTAYITAYLCGTATANNTVFGIVSRTAGNATLTHVAGRDAGGVQTDNALATNTYFFDMGGIAIDGSGQLYIALRGDNRIRRIGTAGRVFTVAGDGIAGYSGDYVAATTAQLQTPAGLALTPAGHLVVADYYNHAFRMIW